MKAIRVHEWGAAEVMRLEEVPDPTAGPGEAVVRIEAAGVNPVDTYIRSGTYTKLPPLPFVPGNDAAGGAENLAFLSRRRTLGLAPRLPIGGPRRDKTDVR